MVNKIFLLGFIFLFLLGAVLASSFPTGAILSTTANWAGPNIMWRVLE